MGIERVGDTLSAKPWSLDGLLWIHAEHQRVQYKLHVRLGLLIASGTANGQDGLAVFADNVVDHFVIDDADYNDGPNEAITAAEAFLSGITACAVLMLERLAREGDIPLKWVNVSMDATRDREAVHEVHSVYDLVRMRFELTGPSEAQSRELVETYKRR